MLQKIGYSLVDTSNNEVQFWGNSPGMLVSAPERISIPSQDIIYDGVQSFIEGKSSITFSNGYRLIERWINSNPNTEIDIKVSETIEFSNNKTIVTYNYQDPNLVTLKSYKKTKLATKRWQIETGGTSYNGNSFATDRESQTKYTAVAVAISQADTLTWSINWKTNEGDFITMNALEMSNVINYVLNHVQNSFNTEYQFQQQIDACTTTSQVNAIDLNVGW